MSTQAKLYYFDGRGRAEIIRYMLSAASIPFIEVFMKEREQFEKFISDGMFLFGQVPVLEIDGIRLAQSGAILRYVARKGGLMGRTDQDAALIDMHFEASRDLGNRFAAIGFMKKEDVLKALKEQEVAKFLPIFEQVLKLNGTGYLVGSSLTMGDVGLIEALVNAVEYYGLSVLDPFAELKKFHTTMTSLERIATFLKGPQRKGPNDDTYMETVRRVLKWDSTTKLR